jgi:hypothetical protein
VRRARLAAAASEKDRQILSKTPNRAAKAAVSAIRQNEYCEI